MTRRSPTNKRYQKDTKPVGSTKKSAASAKPKRGTEGKTSTSAKTTAKRAHYSVPDTPEYKQARKHWWMLLIAAIAMLAISLALTGTPVAETLSLDEDTVRYVGVMLSWVALGFIGISWWVDLKQIRPMIKAHQAELTGKTIVTKKDAKKNTQDDTKKDADA